MKWGVTEEEADDFIQGLTKAKKQRNIGNENLLKNENERKVKREMRILKHLYLFAKYRFCEKIML